MSPPEVWGPPTWIFFHVLAEKMNEKKFNVLMPQVFQIIKRLCAFLPCPDCSKHATNFLNKIKMKEIDTKEKFVGMLYLFHNSVNFRKKKKMFNFKNMIVYKNINIISAYNNFIRVYNTKGNMSLLTESFQRDLILTYLRKWLKHNIFYFMDNEKNLERNNHSQNDNSSNSVISSSEQQQKAQQEEEKIQEDEQKE